MSTTNTMGLWQTKALKFGLDPGTAAHTSIFLDALLCVLVDLRVKALLTVADITDLQTPIALASTSYYAVLSLGLDYYMSVNNEFNVLDLDKAEDMYQDALKTAQMVNQKARIADETAQTRLGDKDDE